MATTTTTTKKKRPRSEEQEQELEPQQEERQEAQEEQERQQEAQERRMDAATRMDAVRWRVVSGFFSANTLVSHNVDAYDAFVRTGLRRVLSETNPMRVALDFDADLQRFRSTALLWFGGKDGSAVYFSKPVVVDAGGDVHALFPNEARLRDLTYASAVHCDIEVEIVRVLLPGTIPTATEGGVKRSTRWALGTNVAEQRRSGAAGAEEEEEDAAAAEAPLTEEEAAQTAVSLFPLDASAAPNQATRERVQLASRAGAREQRFSMPPVQRHFLLNLPIMVQSSLCVLRGLRPAARAAVGECESDVGGYFVIAGKEKAVIPQEGPADNVLLVRLFSEEEDAAASAFDVEARVRSVSEDASKPLRSLVLRRMRASARLAGGHIRAQVANLRLPVPLFVLFRALGLGSDREILELILQQPLESMTRATLAFFRPSVQDAATVHTQSEALNWLALTVKGSTSALLAGSQVERVQYILADLFLAHVGETCWRAKARYLAHMARELFLVAVRAKAPTDRDHFKNKRVASVGQLMTELVRENFLAHRRLLGVALESAHVNTEGRYRDVSVLLEQSWGGAVQLHGRVLDAGVMGGFKGRWGLTAQTRRVGVVQDLSRVSYLGYLWQLRKVVLPMDDTSKLVEPRMLHGSQYAIIDPLDTPDSNIGAHKSLSVLAAISGRVPRAQVLAWLGANSASADVDVAYRLVDPDLQSAASASQLTRVFVNGLWFASTPDPLALMRAFKRARRAGAMDRFVSAAFVVADNAVTIWSDSGRLGVPVFFRDEGGEMSYRHAEWWKTEAELLQEQEEGQEEEQEEGLLWARMTGAVSGVPALVEFMDTQERECALVSTFMQSRLRGGRAPTHQEIDPSTLYGMMSNLINYPEHNPSVRNTFSASQSKQAVSQYVTCVDQRMDKTAYVLEGGQQPLVQSRYARIVDGGRNPYGVNARVAIMCYTGANVEDALLINAASLARGMFRTAYYTTYTAHETTELRGGGKGGGDGDDDDAAERAAAGGAEGYTTQLTDFGPLLNVGGVRGLKSGADYTKLDARGLARVGSLVDERTVIIGMTGWALTRGAAAAAPRAAAEDDEDDYENDDENAAAAEGAAEGAAAEGAAAVVRRCRSVMAKKGASGVVDRVFVVPGGVPGRRVAKVRVRSMRTPELGDKFASRAGQKGTIGRIVAAEDMPFFADGTQPDMVMNPHALPSRRTLGHVIEMLSTALGAHLGAFADCTAFASGRGTDAASAEESMSSGVVASVSRGLIAAGLHSEGLRVAMSGPTGRVLEASVFSGTTYYMRLKHMVADKVNWRSRGQMMALTRQPNGGRADDGGLRVGEMERDVMIAHGGAQIVQDAMMDRSDAYSLTVCNATGQVAVWNPAERRMFSLAADGPPQFDGAAAGARSTLRQASTHGRSFSTVRVPYALKTYLQELGASGVRTAMVTSETAARSARAAQEYSGGGGLSRAARELPPSSSGKRAGGPGAALVRATERALLRPPQGSSFAAVAPTAEEEEEDNNNDNDNEKKKKKRKRRIADDDDDAADAAAAEGGLKKLKSLPYDSEADKYRVYTDASARRRAADEAKKTGEEDSGEDSEGEEDSEGGATFAPLDKVHLRGDTMSTRLWTVQSVDAQGGKLVVSTMDAHDLSTADTKRIVEPDDLYRPSRALVHAASALDATGGVAAGGVAAGGVHFAPVINIINGRRGKDGEDGEDGEDDEDDEDDGGGGGGRRRVPSLTVRRPGRAPVFSSGGGSRGGGGSGGGSGGSSGGGSADNIIIMKRP